MEAMGIDDAFWRGKTVFLTGHTGFKGGWLVLMLQRLGAAVWGYSLPPNSEPNLFEAARIGDGVRSVFSDVRDAESLAAAMIEAAPEIAFHLAAQPLVRASYNDPVGTYSVNVMGTIHFIEAVRRAPSVRAAIVVTSDKCYENREWVWAYRENDPLGGKDPYSSSKACAELVTSAYRSSFFADGRVALASVRAGNVIGGGDWAADRLLPDAVRAFSSGQALKVRDIGAVRPWQHVLEPLNGYLRLARMLREGGQDFSGAWNFGPRPEGARTVGEVAQCAVKLWGGGARWEQDGSQQPKEAHFLKLDSTLAGSRLGWEPRLDFQTALEWTIAWYRAHGKSDADMRAFSLEQIEKYERSSPRPVLMEAAVESASSRPSRT